MANVTFTYDQLMNPVLQALRTLGGSGTNEEINNKVAEIAAIPSEQLDVLHRPSRGGMTEFEYRLMWTRTYLKQYGLIDNSMRGVWALTAKGAKVEQVDERAVVRFVQERAKRESHQPAADDGPPNTEAKWQEDLLGVVLSIDPTAFERLIQRMLRESGFTQVEVTGRTGDGGIDGHGIMRLGGLLSFRVIFQCKRWRGSVGASAVRDFRGAMVGRADKGLLITTGSFSKDAIREATRDGAPAIDLVDGDQLAGRLKDLALGVQTKRIEVEQVSVDKMFFANI